MITILIAFHAQFICVKPSQSGQIETRVSFLQTKPAMLVGGFFICNFSAHYWHLTHASLPLRFAQVK